MTDQLCYQVQFSIALLLSMILSYLTLYTSRVKWFQPRYIDYRNFTKTSMDCLFCKKLLMQSSSFLLTFTFVFFFGNFCFRFHDNCVFSINIDVNLKNKSDEMSWAKKPTMSLSSRTVRKFSAEAWTRISDDSKWDLTLNISNSSDY